MNARLFAADPAFSERTCFLCKVPASLESFAFSEANHGGVVGNHGGFD